MTLCRLGAGAGRRARHALVEARGDDPDGRPGGEISRDGPDRGARVDHAPPLFVDEGQEVFRALAERFPGFRLDNQALEYQPSITFRSLKSLPINWQ